MNNLYLDINVLQTVPSSNINRDDTGAPKTAIYGGVTRARVSSQSWKRAIRLAFQSQTKDAEWLQSYRTVKIVSLLAEKIKDNSDLSDEEAEQKAEETLKGAGVTFKKAKNTDQQVTSALFLVSEGQLDKLAKYVLSVDKIDKKVEKEIKNILNSNQSLDLAMFGRMAADNPELNVDASTQVAHAISTHEIVPEFDYYTAVDDVQEKNQTGAAMIDTIQYNSSTLYRYANVNVNELMHNLGNKELTVEGIKLFIKDFLLTMPTGKENTFANKTLPQYVLINLRDDTPVNLVTAFEEPIKSNNGYVAESIKKLEEENNDVNKLIDDPLMSIVLTTKDSTIKNQADSTNDLIEKVSEAISQRLNDENIND